MTYEYAYTDSLGGTFEWNQPMSDAPLSRHPETGRPCKRLITGGGGVIFKGHDWPDKNVGVSRVHRKPDGSLGVTK